MSVTMGLKNTPKGQLQYSRYLNKVKLKDQLDHLSPPPLSHLHEEKESSKVNLSFGLDPAEFFHSLGISGDFNENCSNRSEELGLSDSGHLTSKQDSKFSSREEKSDVSKKDKLGIVETLSAGGDANMLKKAQSISCPVSPEFGYTSCAIVDAEKKWDQVAQQSLSKRQAEFEHHDRSLSYLIDNKEQETFARLIQQRNHRQLMIERKLRDGVEEGYRRRQRLKEDHDEHLKKISIKEKEIERKRELLKEEDRKRKEKISKLHSLWRDIESNLQAFFQRHDNFKYKTSLPEIIDKYRAVLEKVYTNLASQIQAADNHHNIDELVAKFELDKEKSLQALKFLEKQTEETEQKIITEESKQRELENKRVEEAAQAQKQQAEAANDLTVQSLAFILKDFEAKSKELAQVEATIRPFIENVKNKTFRFNIQRAVNTPINAISDFSGPHLTDKLNKLKELLRGQIAHLAGNSTPGSVSPDVLLFCQNLVAKMLVKKGEEQVTSKHESAFPIGIVVVALWEEFPIVGELFLAHLQALCPYVLPMYFTRQNDQSSIDYHKSQGYRVSEDGTIEEQDKFLRRMSGLMRLYCSCMVAPLPPGINSPHPHGLDNAWRWLARTMNLEPHPDVTAAMIYDVLSVTGHALYREYRVQFAKMLYLLTRSYLPKLESVSVTSATVGRLKIFLETAMQSARIPPPEGLLSPNFFFKPPDPVQ